MSARDVCPCVLCEVDRERKRLRYIAHGGAGHGLYLQGYQRDNAVGPKETAVLFGPRHAAVLRQGWVVELADP